MKLTTPTLIERAAAYIRVNGSARSPELAEHLKVKAGAIAACLAPAVQAGFFVTCRVGMEESQRSVNEYRLSAQVSECSQTWGEFKHARRNAIPEKPLKTPGARPPRVPQTDVQHTAPAAQTANTAFAKSAADSPCTEWPITERATPAAADQRTPERIVFMLDTNGRLRIELGGKTILLSNEETRDVGELLVASEPIWS